VLEGERAHRPLPAAGPRYAAGMPERPKGMTAAARRTWDAYLEQMASMGILRPVDAFALCRLCEDVAMLQELQAGLRKIASERERPERERRKRLRSIQDEVKSLVAEGKLLDRLEELRAEEARLEAQRPEGPALLALTMSHEGRRLSATINTLAARICREEMQFGLTPVSSQRLEGLTGGIIPGVTAQDGSIEAILCG
jgi:Phage terminase, small subunit